MITLPLLTESPVALASLADVSVLYTDLDGTLLAPGGSVLADADGAPTTLVAEAIVALSRAGVSVVPVSGRTRLQLIEISRLLGWTDFIAELGCVLVRGTGATREVTYNTGDWPEGLLGDGQTPYEAIRDSGAFAVLQREFPGRIEYHAPWHHHRQATHLLRGSLDTAEAQVTLDALDLPVAILDNGIVRPPAHGLNCEGPIHGYHLVPAGVSKAQALALDLSQRGLIRAEAAAIGDSATDLRMAPAVAVMALVANAFDSPRLAAALAVTPADNVVRLTGECGDGWSEFASAWLTARQVNRQR